MRVIYEKFLKNLQVSIDSSFKFLQNSLVLRPEYKRIFLNFWFFGKIFSRISSKFQFFEKHQHFHRKLAKNRKILLKNCNFSLLFENLFETFSSRRLRPRTPYAATHHISPPLVHFDYSPPALPKKLPAGATAHH